MSARSTPPSASSLSQYLRYTDYMVRESVTGVGVLDKAVAILDAVEREPRSLPDLVAATGLPRATAHRLAFALTAHGLVGRDAEGRFVLGLRFTAARIAETARPALE